MSSFLFAKFILPYPPLLAVTQNLGLPFDGRGDMNAFVLTSPLAGVMLLTRRQPFYPSAAHDKFFSIRTAFGGYTEFGIAPVLLISFAPEILGIDRKSPVHRCQTLSVRLYATRGFCCTFRVPAPENAKQGLLLRRCQ